MMQAERSSASPDTGTLAVIIVPARQSGAHIEASARSLAKQDYQNTIVIYSLEEGDRDAEKFRSVTEQYQNFIVIETKLQKRPGRNANELRNAAAFYFIEHLLPHTVAEQVVFLATDMKITHPEDWISLGVFYQLSGNVDAVGGIMLGELADDERFMERFLREFTDKALLARNPRVTQPYIITKENFGDAESLPITATLLFTLEIFLITQGFNRRFRDSYEDYEFDWRIVKSGGRIFFTGEWVVFHKHRSSLDQIKREYARSGRGAAQFATTHPDSPYAVRRLKQVMAVLFFTGFGLFLGLVTILTQLWLLLLLGVIGIVGLFVVAGVANAIKARLWFAFFFPVLTAYFILVFSINFARKLAEGGGEASSDQFLQLLL